ncbi:MAG: histidine kinase, partial [Mariniphaga sp.]|nr:histidine kinase [Mariniphaga sp.]
LDYILYQVNKPKVSLKEEVLHIKEYIELEKIRFQETLKVEFTAGEIDENIQVAPMLLIPFVENAFKHGTLEKGFLNINIRITVVKNQLDFYIENTYLSRAVGHSNGGIGLENVRKRLDLNYKNNYLLSNEIKGNRYAAKLTIFNLNNWKNE